MRLIDDGNVIATGTRIEYVEHQFGWLVDGGVIYADPARRFVAVEDAPAVVSMRQARLALLGAGVLDAVNAAIAQAGGAAEIEWEYATEVRRDSPLVAAMAQALSLDDAALDALFLTAAGL